ncbi:MAG: hypothetical protein QM571_00790 [Micrococcaceae bacterium]
MRPFSIEECNIETKRVRLSKLLKQEFEDNFSYENDISLDDYLTEIFISGFPGIRYF